MEGCHAYDQVTPVEALTLDRFVSIGTTKELKKLYLAKRRVGLTAPLHWMSLAPRWRDCVMIPLEECPEAARRKFLKLEVFGLHPGIPPRIIQRMFSPLESLGCDVMVRLPVDHPEMMGALRGVRAVGVDLAELPGKDRSSDDALFAQLRTFRLAARDHNMASYVWSCRRWPLIQRLIADGYSLVNGPGVSCDVGHPVLPTTGRFAQ